MLTPLLIVDKWKSRLHTGRVRFIHWPMKILFLDIDGVVNSRRTALAFGGYPHDFSPAGMARFDPVAIAMVRRLCRETKTSIVLSSTWRLHFTVAEVAAGLDLPVIDHTPNSPAGYDGRGHEIAAWLAAHPEVDSYAIVDDQAVMLPEQAAHFGQTDEACGLSLDDYDRLYMILTDTDMAVA